MPGLKNCCSPDRNKDESCGTQAANMPENGCSDNSISSCWVKTSTEMPGYKISPFVSGWLDTSAGKVPQVTTQLSSEDHRGRWAMRWGVGRNAYRITPGLYATGTPGAESPLLVSANYKLSFDCLRSSLKGLDTWILVIDTQGVNVWCAAGKGTFGTDEIISRCKTTQVDKIVSHNTLIVPQLGAPGVAAHLVKKEIGFNVIYGPVRAEALPEFLSAGMKATAPMRRVTFTTMERFILTPVEITVMRKTIIYFALLLFLLSGFSPSIFSFEAAWQRGISALVPGIVGLLSGSVITPVLLPWLPGRFFAVKGAIVGIATSSILLVTYSRQADTLEKIALYLFVTAIASYTAMNFTGSCTFTSPSGVEKEMRKALPWQAFALLSAAILWISTAFEKVLL